MSGSVGGGLLITEVYRTPVLRQQSPRARTRTNMLPTPSTDRSRVDPESGCDAYSAPPDERRRTCPEELIPAMGYPGAIHRRAKPAAMAQRDGTNRFRAADGFPHVPATA